MFTGPREKRRAYFVPSIRSVPPVSMFSELNSKMPSVTTIVGQATGRVEYSDGPVGVPNTGCELSSRPVVRTSV